MSMNNRISLLWTCIQQQSNLQFCDFNGMAYSTDTLFYKVSSKQLSSNITKMQGCQLSLIWRDSHALDLLLTHSRNS